jgi:predicted metal-dependent peptidase
MPVEKRVDRTEIDRLGFRNRAVFRLHRYLSSENPRTIWGRATWKEVLRKILCRIGADFGLKVR